MNSTRTVLIYLKVENKILMLLRNKKENDYNANKWIGVGGKVQEHESVYQALIREVKEETNLQLIDAKYIGLIDFIDNDYYEEMYLFTSSSFSGLLKECDEGTLSFIDADKIDSLDLWEGDRIFLPFVIREEEFKKLTLTYDNGKLISYNLIK